MATLIALTLKSHLSTEAVSRQSGARIPLGQPKPRQSSQIRAFTTDRRPYAVNPCLPRQRTDSGTIFSYADLRQDLPSKSTTFALSSICNAAATTEFPRNGYRPSTELLMSIESP